MQNGEKAIDIVAKSVYGVSSHVPSCGAYQAQTSSVQSICTRLGIARRTFYRYLATRVVMEA